jgi:hypothetical protein
MMQKMDNGFFWALVEVIDTPGSRAVLDANTKADVGQGKAFYHVLGITA